MTIATTTPTRLGTRDKRCRPFLQHVSFTPLSPLLTLEELLRARVHARTHTHTNCLCGLFITTDNFHLPFHPPPPSCLLSSVCRQKLDSWQRGTLVTKVTRGEKMRVAKRTKRNADAYECSPKMAAVFAHTHKRAYPVCRPLPPAGCFARCFFFLCVSEKGVCLLVSNVISVLSFNDLVCDATSL